MKCAFPTMWYRFKDNLYGDGSKTDPDYFIKGFPRFHEDFENQTVHFPAGLTSNHNRPSNLLQTQAREFIERFGKNSFDVNMISKKKQHEMLDWLIKNHAWDNMRNYILTVCPVQSKRLIGLTIKRS